MRLWLKMKIIGIYGSQAKFAIACGKTDNWISRIITERESPNEEEKQLIISKLGVDYGMDDLFNHQNKVKL